jgi:hypothetical protein
LTKTSGAYLFIVVRFQRLQFFSSQRKIEREGGRERERERERTKGSQWGLVIAYSITNYMYGSNPIIRGTVL